MLSRYLPISILALVLLAACGSSSSTGGNGGGGGHSGPIMSCDEIMAKSCFSNMDCTSSDDRCEDKGTSDNPVACCVPGERGTGQAGDPCTKTIDCESGACVYGMSGNTLCSPPCTSDGDCPADIPTCVAIAPSAGTGSFCGAPG